MLRFVNSRAALGTPDLILWSSVVPAGGPCPWDEARGGVVCASAGGITALVTGPGPGVLTVLQQGASGAFSGDFAADEFLLSAAPSNLPISIAFDAPVSAVGAQIQPTGIVGRFRGVMEVVTDAGSRQFPFEGESGNAGRGTALFAGVLDDAPTISRVTFRTTTARRTGCPCVINQLSIRRPGPVVASLKQ